MVDPDKCPLVGFGGTRAFPLGAITLAVKAGDYPWQITREVMFLVRLLIHLQRHSRTTHSQFLEGGDLNIPLDD